MVYLALINGFWILAILGVVGLLIIYFNKPGPGWVDSRTDEQKMWSKRGRELAGFSLIAILVLSVVFTVFSDVISLDYAINLAKDKISVEEGVTREQIKVVGVVCTTSTRYRCTTWAAEAIFTKQGDPKTRKLLISTTGVVDR